MLGLGTLSPLLRVQLLPRKGHGVVALAAISALSLLAHDSGVSAPSFEELVAALRREQQAQSSRTAGLCSMDGPGDDGDEARVRGQARANAFRHSEGGWTVFPVLSRFNHSCWPNACALHGQGRAVVYALREVAAGDELTISYLDLGQPLPFEQRRAVLREQFGFDCECELCAQRGIAEVDRLLGPSAMSSEVTEELEKIRHLASCQPLCAEETAEFQTRCRKLLKALFSSTHWMAFAVRSVFLSYSDPTERAALLRAHSEAITAVVP
eukprot:RCo045722